MGANSTPAPDGATTFTTNDDAAIFAAWHARLAAFAKLTDLRPEDDNAPYSPEEQAQWDIIDAAEMTLRSTIAATAEGIEAQIWTSLYHVLSDNDQTNAARDGDLDYFLAHDDDLDWSDKLAIAAIRSLRAQRDAESAFAEAWLSRWTGSGGAVVLDGNGEAQVSFTIYEFSLLYIQRQEHPAMPKSSAEQWDSARYHGMMNALFDALKMVPGGADMIKRHIKAKGLRCAVPVGAGAA